MRAFLFVLFVFVFATPSVGQDQPPQLSGKWKATEKDLIVALYEGKDGLYYGKDPKGHLVLDRLRYDAKEGVYRGTLQPPDRPSPIPVTVLLEGRDRLRLEVRKFFITKTLYLIRCERD